VRPNQTAVPSERLRLYHAPFEPLVSKGSEGDLRRENNAKPSCYTTVFEFRFDAKRIGLLRADTLTADGRTTTALPPVDVVLVRRIV